MSRFLPLLVICIMLCGADSLLAFQSASNHFSITAPDGWTDVPPAMRDQLAKMLTKPGSQPPKIEAAWMRQPNMLSRPSVVVVYATPGAQDLDAIERNLPQLMAQKQAASAVPVPTPRVEREKHRMVAEFPLTPPNGPPFKGIAYSFFGKEALANLQCFAPADRFAEDSSGFTAFADSFRFDPGYEYTQAASANRRAGGGAVVLVVLLAAAVCTYFLLFKKKRMPPVQ